MKERLFITPEYTTAKEIKRIRKELHLTQKEFAEFINCSKPTVERWERSEEVIRGPIVPFLRMLQKYPEYEQEVKVPEKIWPLRMWYMYGQDVCTLIDVNERERKVKIKNYTEYMSDIITAVKGQAVVMSNEDDINFTISELVKRVTILMKHELKNAIINLNTDIKVDENLTLNGDVNNLVQVINNMISNAIQAYNGKENESIEFTITKDSKNIIFSIEDHAGGLPDKVTDKLFKEMITTKGKNGTGLGLYMSYSTIKAHFNGNITFDTKKGKGTKFNIYIPM